MNKDRLDENLILEMAAGSKDAFRELYGATSNTVYGFALSILRSRQDAEDVMHDAYIRIFRSAKAYTPEGKPLAWMLTIVKNLCYNKLRDSSQTESLNAEDMHIDPEDPSDMIGTADDRLVLDTALEILDDSEREIVIMHAVSGYKHREIAELMEMPQGTVLSKYKRALAKLKEALDPSGHSNKNMKVPDRPNDKTIVADRSNEKTMELPGTKASRQTNDIERKEGVDEQG